jgi:hypothetical protein
VKTAQRLPKFNKSSDCPLDTTIKSANGCEGFITYFRPLYSKSSALPNHSRNQRERFYNLKLAAIITDASNLISDILAKAFLLFQQHLFHIKWIPVILTV